MQVGDYARTKKGFIGKVNVITQYNVNIEDKKIVQLINITKTSPNIIDLIEAGDYVNGMEVMEADWFNENGEYEEGLAFPMYASDDLQVIENWLPLRSVNIKSIVTKEQFKSMEYRIEE